MPNLVETYYEPFWQNITDTFHSIPCPDRVLLPTTGSGNRSKSSVVVRCYILSLTYQSTITTRSRALFPFITVSSAPSLTGTKHHGAVVTCGEAIGTDGDVLCLPLLHSWVGKDPSRGQPGLPDGLSLLLCVQPVSQRLEQSSEQTKDSFTVSICLSLSSWSST